MTAIETRNHDTYAANMQALERARIARAKATIDAAEGEGRR